jgi:hypothetical protein
MASADTSPIGLAGRITTPTRGGTETFIARSATPLAKGQAVIVVQTLGPRTVIVMPWTDPVDSLLEL